MATHSMDRGAWLVIVHGVAQSWTRLKQLNISKNGKGSFLLGERVKDGAPLA